MDETVAIALEDVTKTGGMHRNKAMLGKVTERGLNARLCSLLLLPA